MHVELINTGSELMLGRTLNTHQQWLCRRLADLGYVVNCQVAVADTAHDICRTVGEALSRSDLVITTGGLGPTSDDVTREMIAGLLEKELREDAAVLERICAFYASRNREMPDRVRVQALVPEGAVVLSNANGTAPGLAIEARPNPFRLHRDASWLIMLPGPPRELRPMFNESVVPLLARVLPPEKSFTCRTVRTVGVPESILEQKIEGHLKPLLKDGLGLGYCARVGQVDVRLTAYGDAGARLVAEAERLVRGCVGSSIFGVDDEELETHIVRVLTERKQTLAIAESCTGGTIANRITNVPGASAVLLAGLVTYSNESKQKFLGVRPDTLATQGAVSEAVAREMAEGVRRQTGADYAVSVTGIAGPGGGTEVKPVGTVFIGLAGPQGSVVEKQFNPTDRETFKQTTAQQALNHLRRMMAD